MLEFNHTREIEQRDMAALPAFLASHFPRKDAQEWQTALDRLAARPRIDGLPWLGYCIEDGGIQGAFLTVASTRSEASGQQIISNVSTWCVNPSHRGPIGRELLIRATADDNITHSDLSAAPHVIKTITRLGFAEWSAGQMIGVGTRYRPKARIVPLAELLRTPEGGRIGAMLEDHHAMGCIVFGIAHDDGIAPIVFLRRRIARTFPAAQLIYCQDLTHILDHGANIAAHLLRFGLPAMLMDSSGPLPGIRGRYFPGKAPKYYKGRPPRAAVDHCYSEMVYIGF